jgi:hypothetical protein
MMHYHYDGWKNSNPSQGKMEHVTNLLKGLQSYQPSILFKTTSKSDHICNIVPNVANVIRF